MNRTDRLLAIVLELQARGRQRAEDLAATFEVSKRSIYRDIQALGEAGVPLISVPGQGYSLMKGYFLPPLSFTVEETTILLLGSDVMDQSFDAQYRLAAQSASRKIEGVLPEQLRDEVAYLRTAIRFVVANSREDSQERVKLQQLRRAIIDHAVVRFVYHTRYGTNNQMEQQTREADPYSLVYISRSWYLAAYCHLRQAMRHFRLDRMETLEILPQTFRRIAGRGTDLRQSDEPGSIKVRVLFDHEVVRWIREARSYYLVAEEETVDGLLVTFSVRRESEIFQWLLSWGRHAHVLEPVSLRKQLAEEAQAMLQNFDYSE